MYIVPVLALLSWALTLGAQIYEPLQQHRAIAEQLIPYTAADRVRVAQEAQKMLKFYVNRELKVSWYGPEIDPLPKIERLIQDAPGMNDRDFHDSMSQLFKSQRDGHLVYTYPGKQSCFTAYTGLEFNIVENGDIVVSEMKSGIPRNNEFDRIQLGDSLIAFDGQLLPQLYESLVWELSAGNTDAIMRRLLLFLESRSGSRFKMPQQDTFEVRLKRRGINEEYTVILPWLVTANENCLKYADSVMQVNRKKRHLERRSKFNRLVPRNDIFLEKRAESGRYSGIPWYQTDSPVIFWQKFRTNNFELGLLRISNFNRTVFDSTTADLIAGLLSNQLKGTDGLLLDVRDNNGGSVAAAASLVQLFKESPASMFGRLKITEEIRSLFNQNFFSVNPESQAFIRAISQSSPGQDWSISFTYPDYTYIQKLPVLYTKPVGILTNANCFSSCEFFTALMKDNGVATIFGEDLRTRGGGATILGHQGTFSYDTRMFNPLPFASGEALDASLASQDMWIALCQLTRQNGKLIEGFGVESDYLFRPSIEDILPGGQNTQQLAMIASILKQKQTSVV